MIKFRCNGKSRILIVSWSFKLVLFLDCFSFVFHILQYIEHYGIDLVPKQQF